jgi:tRNA A37 threonylcarbamoyltransferase TsaD
MNDCWTQQMTLLARNDAGVTTIVGATFDDAIGNLTMATITPMAMQATTSGTTVNIQVVGGNTMVVTVSADMWISP